MSKVLKLGITSKFGKKIISVQNIEVVQGRGILKDRHFSVNKNKKEQTQKGTKQKRISDIWYYLTLFVSII